MGQTSRIKIDKYEYAELISEVDGLCPLCLEKLIPITGDQRINMSQAAHIYPHSPTEEEIELLKDVPRLSEDPEKVENLIMLCPNCHYKFDHPRTVEGYMELYYLKQQLINRRKVKEYYKKHDIEKDLVSLLNWLGTVNIESDLRKLSYNVMNVHQKMSRGASNSIKQLVIRDVRDYYLPIHDALVQLEQDFPGKSDLIAKEVGLFYSELMAKGLSQDSIYRTINDWLCKRYGFSKKYF